MPVTVLGLSLAVGCDESKIRKDIKSGKLSASKKIVDGYRKYVIDPETAILYKAKYSKYEFSNPNRLTVAEAAKLSKTHQRTVAYHITAGILPAKMYRYRNGKRFEIEKADFDKYLKKPRKPKGRSPARKQDCIGYNICLDEAARKNKKSLGCQLCNQYKINPAWMLSSG